MGYHCDICDVVTSLPSELIIAQANYWTVNLANKDQTFLGRSYITLRNHKSELDELSTAEEQEFIILRNKLIRSLKENFDPLTFNISCLKNDAFKEKPDITPSSAAHVHWHVIPRYRSASIKFDGVAYQDPMPGRYIDSARPRFTPTKAQQVHIAQTIRSRF